LLPAVCVPTLQSSKNREAQDDHNYGGAKPTKPPVCALTGGAASVSDPKTWASYDVAAAYAARYKLPGIGRVLTADDGIIGGDLDNVRDPATGEIVQWAKEIVDYAETYWEVSPSGTGLRFFAAGKLDEAVKYDEANVELYAQGRYLTITGQHVAGTPTEILPALKTINELKARVAALKAKANGKANGEAHGPEGENAYSSFADTKPRSDYRLLNDAALKNLDCWVPPLFGDKAKKSGLGFVMLEPDRQVSHDGFGIRKFGDASVVSFDRAYEGFRHPI
jgi:primase-polymerase (primpol)-like protein